MNKNTYSLYILKCSDGTYYTGITTDLERRIEEHNFDDKKGAKYTKSRRPVKLVFLAPHIPNRSLASIGERYVKSLSRRKKQLLIDGDEKMTQLLDHLINV